MAGAAAMLTHPCSSARSACSKRNATRRTANVVEMPIIRCNALCFDCILRIAPYGLDELPLSNEKQNPC